MTHSAYSTQSDDAVVAAAKERDLAGKAVIGTYADGTIVYWNEMAVTLYGWTAENALGKNVLDVTPTNRSLDEAAHIMEHMRAGRDWAGEFMVRRRDGTPMVVHVTTIPVRDGDRVIGVVGVSYLDSRRTPGSMRAIKEE